MRTGTFAFVLTLVLAALAAPASAASQSSYREQARPAYTRGWEFMKAENWESAAKSFQEAVDKDSEFEDAYYGLGLANMRLRKYAEALSAYTRCRDLYLAAAGKRFADRQEAQRYRQDRLREIDEIIRSYQGFGTQSAATTERLRQLNEQRRQLQEYFQRGVNMSVDNTIPGFVHLALGSAYFRIEQWPAAEREYKAAIAADPRSGEAFNNLAVVYLQTGRFKEADDAVRSAEKAGFKVHPQLKADIKAKLG
jgi:tetratricopeptide (TPR) repeat protein